MNRCMAGGLAGFAATVPMTAAMLALHRRLPTPERYHLPPRELTVAVARRAGHLERHMDDRARRRASLAAHYAYGAATGALYGGLPKGLRRSALAAGATYGVVVWGASYLGWVPALRLLKPATEHPARRNALMIAAHVVWGGATGILTAALTTQEERGRSPATVVAGEVDRSNRVDGG